MDASRGLPAALEKLSKGDSKKVTLVDNRDVRKPYVLGDNEPDEKFRMWAIKM